MMTFKSFADFKRSIKVGMRFQATNHLYPSLSGERVISRVQGNALACWYTKPDGTRAETWCPYPKAAMVRVEGERVTFLDVDGSPAFTYYGFTPVEAAPGDASGALAGGGAS